MIALIVYYISFLSSFWIHEKLVILLSYTCVDIILAYFSYVDSTAFDFSTVFASVYLCPAFVCNLSSVYKMWFVINVKMKMA